MGAKIDLALAGHSLGAQDVQPSYQPGVRFGDLDRCLPGFVLEAIREALPRAGSVVVTRDGQASPLPLLNLRDAQPPRRRNQNQEGEQ